MSMKNGIAYDFKKGTSEKDVTIVFVPGSGCIRKIYSGIIQLLDYDCYAIDLPGHGESENTGYSIENYVDSVAEFVSDLNNVIIVGHSLGGTICIGVAAKNLPSVKGCVLLSTGSSYPKVDPHFVNSVKEGKPDLDYFVDCFGKIEEDVNSFFITGEVLLKDLKIDIELNLDDELDKINVPTQIFVGGGEILTIVEYSEFIHEKVKNSTLTIYPEERHLLLLNQKEKTAEIINKAVEESIK